MMLPLLSKDMEVEFTNEWWSRTVNDKKRLIAWLHKLHGTEIGGFDDYTNFIAQYEMDARTKTIFQNIAADELRHGGLIADLCDSMNQPIIEMPKSTYWAEMNENIIDLKSAAAVNYFGEALAAFRFEVIMEHPETTDDIKNLLSVVLPDEQFHRTTLNKIAGSDLIEQLQSKHDAAVARLKRKQFIDRS